MAYKSGCNSASVDADGNFQAGQLVVVGNGTLSGNGTMTSGNFGISVGDILNGTVRVQGGSTDITFWHNSGNGFNVIGTVNGNGAGGVGFTINGKLPGGGNAGMAGGVHFGGDGVGGFFNFHWFVPGTGGFIGAWGYYDGHNNYAGGGAIGAQW